MVAAWIVLLMRLAATNDVLRVKYKLQSWLVTQGRGPHPHHVCLYCQCWCTE